MNRNDVHSPANFDPAAYTYIGTFDQWPEPGAFLSQTWSDYDTDFGTVRALNFTHAEYTAGRDLLEREGANIHYGATNGCDHCGARIRYVSIFRHTNGQVVAVGSTCAEERFGCDSRREYDVKRLKERAASERERAKAFGKANEFVQANCPELTDWLLTPAAETVHSIFADLARKLIRYGSLSEKQVAFARKLLQEYYEKQRNGGKTDRQLQWEVEKAAAADCPTGRTKIVGTVIKTEVRESQYGSQLKMTVKDDAGFVVWSTIPSSLALVEPDGFQRGLEKGDRVEFFAALTPSDRDPKFGFGKRPTGGRLLGAVPQLATA